MLSSSWNEIVSELKFGWKCCEIHSILIISLCMYKNGLSISSVILFNFNQSSVGVLVFYAFMTSIFSHSIIIFQLSVDADLNFKLKWEKEER